MQDFEFAVYLIALGFVSLLNLLVMTALWLAFRTSKHRYLKIAIIAAAIESARVVIDLILSVNTESFFWYGTSQTFQFASTLMLGLTVLHIFDINRGVYKVALTFFGLGFFPALYAEIVFSPVAGTALVYLVNLPLLGVTATLSLRALLMSNRFVASKMFLVAASSAYLIIRGLSPALGVTDISLVLYYIEFILFTIMLATFLLYELEFSNERVQKLLDDISQSESDLQFIVDNSLDVILVADPIGLLRSWSAKAQEIFGYTHEQAIKKIHMDELFVSNFWGRDFEDVDQFQARMESIEGRHFLVDVRRREVNHNNSRYLIFVLRLIDEPVATPMLETSKNL